MLLLSALRRRLAHGASAAPSRRGARGVGAPAVVDDSSGDRPKPMAVKVRAVGNVEASSTVDVRAQVSGELLTRRLHRRPRRAAPASCSSRSIRAPFEVALKQAEAALARDTAEAKKREAQLHAHRKSARRRARRPRRLRRDRRGVGRHRRRARRRTPPRIENAKLQLAATRDRAPVAGRTGALLVHRGSLVRANDTAPLVVINQVAPAYVSFAVPARLLPQIAWRPGTRAAGAGRARRQRRRAGRPAPSASSTTPSIRPPTPIRVKATFPNRDRRLWPGAFVDVTLQLSVERARRSSCRTPRCRRASRADSCTS